MRSAIALIVKEDIGNNEHLKGFLKEYQIRALHDPSTHIRGTRK